MLVATSDTQLVESRLKTAAFLERRFRTYVTWRERLLFDTRYAPQTFKTSDVVTLLFVLSGRVSIDAGPPLEAPVAVGFAEREFERVEPGVSSVRSWGEPYVAIELRVAARDVPPAFGEVRLAHSPFVIAPHSWHAASALLESIAVGDPAVSPMCAFLERLEIDGVLVPGVATSIRDEPEHFRRLWAALAPLYQRNVTLVSLLQIKRELGLSIRQLHRDLSELAQTFELQGDGFRSTQKLLRLRAAVLWLSAPEATAADVAAHVGYKSVDAMTRALRELGLPGPSILRDELRCPK